MPHPHIHSPSYAAPVLRAPSPASSLGTSYARDATSFSDTEAELSQAAFQRKWEDKLRLGREFAREWNGEDEDDDDNDDGDGDGRWEGGRAVRDREREGWGVDPLFSAVEGGRTIAEENYMHEKILRSLRYQIHQLEENELFEQTLLTRGGPSDAALSLDHQPTSNDIDTLMRSMMFTTTTTSRDRNGHGIGADADRTVSAAGTVTSGPWNRGVGMESSDVNATPGPGRRSAAKGKGRSQRR